jgi:hypothetical protein
VEAKQTDSRGKESLALMELLQAFVSVLKIFQSLKVIANRHFQHYKATIARTEPDTALNQCFFAFKRLGQLNSVQRGTNVLNPLTI